MMWVLLSWVMRSCGSIVIDKAAALMYIYISGSEDILYIFEIVSLGGTMLSYVFFIFIFTFIHKSRGRAYRIS